jgi:lipoyl(octanoyl) transferase
MKSQNWEFLDTRLNTGKFNMDFDLELVERCKSEDKSFLRFYGWQPYCISLGYNQMKNGESINYLKCGQDGIDVVTRPTGGRAVLHSEELTYSVILKTDKPARQVYKDISIALITGLKLIDESNEELQKISAVADDVNPGRSNICFASSVKDEINYLGKKLVGSAQRKFSDVILQHGSILIGEVHKKILKYLNSTTELEKEMDERTTCLNEILEREVNYDEIKCALLKGFSIDKIGEMNFALQTA